MGLLFWVCGWWCLLIVAVGLPLWVWVSFAISLGFPHGGGDRGLLHLVLIVLMVDWCYSLSISFFLFLFSSTLLLMVDYGLLVVVVSGVCSAAVVGLW